MQTNKQSQLAVLCMLFFLTSLFFHEGALAEALQGTEEPAVYEEKNIILKKERRQRQSHSIQEVARLYREMVSSYKAKRIIRAEELSQKLDTLLDDPILPNAFAKKMRRKQNDFLNRIYGDEAYAKMDIPVDEVGEEKIGQIKQAVEEEGAGLIMPPIQLKEGILVDIETDDHEKVAAHREQRALERERKKEEKKRRREEKIAIKEARHQEKIERKERLRQERIAKREQRRQQYLMDREDRKRQRDIARAQEKSDQHIVEVEKEILMEEQKAADAQEASAATSIKDLTQQRAVKVQEFLDAQEQYLAKEQKEVDYYVELYRKEVEKKKERLMKSLTDKVDALYADGIEFYERKAYHFAYDIFQEVEQLKPDYKLTRQYLAELERYFELSVSNNAPVPLGKKSKREKYISNSLDIYRHRK